MNLIFNYKDDSKTLVDILSYAFNLNIKTDVFIFDVNIPYIMPTGDVLQSVVLSNDFSIGYLLQHTINKELYILTAYGKLYRFDQNDFLCFIRNHKLKLLI